MSEQEVQQVISNACINNYFTLVCTLLIDLQQGQANLKELLKFISGLEAIPPMGLARPISIEYLDHKVLPTASACYCIIRLPVIEDKRRFFIQIDTGVLGSQNHFGVL